MMIDKGVYWDKLSTVKKMGTLIKKVAVMGEYQGKVFARAKFIVDIDIPRFSMNKEYLREAYDFRIITKS